MNNIITTHSGNTRHAVLIHPFGICIKFPKINLFEGLRKLFKIIQLLFEIFVVKTKKQWELEWYVKWIIFGHYEQVVVKPVSYCWMRGIMANGNEFYYYVTNSSNPLLIPTYFSFFGLINIQPIVNPMTTHRYDLFSLFWRSTEIPNEMMGCDSHAWESQNFTQHQDGTIALYDYASTRAWPIVKKYGPRFSRILLPTITSS
ncbi:MAG: hypothetical protein WCG20_01730 [bacterium]